MTGTEAPAAGQVSNSTALRARPDTQQLSPKSHPVLIHDVQHNSSKRAPWVCDHAVSSAAAVHAPEDCEAQHACCWSKPQRAPSASRAVACQERVCTLTAMSSGKVPCSTDWHTDCSQLRHDPCRSAASDAAAPVHATDHAQACKASSPLQHDRAHSHGHSAPAKLVDDAQVMSQSGNMLASTTCKPHAARNLAADFQRIQGMPSAVAFFEQQHAAQSLKRLSNENVLAWQDEHEGACKSPRVTDPTDV